MAVLAIIWLYGHIAKRYYGKEYTQDGYLLQGHYKCRNLVKRLNINYISERNESKNKILRKFPLYNFRNSFIKFKMMALANFNLKTLTYKTLTYKTLI